MLTVGIESVLAEDTYFPSGNGDGSSSKPFQITNASELQAFGSMYKDHSDLWTSKYYNKCYKLTANIQLDNSVENNYIPAGDTGAGNSYENYFQGTFDGNHKTVSGIRYYGSYRVVGLISACKSAIIKDLILQDCRFQSTHGSTNTIVGAVAGYFRDGTIDNCIVIDCVISGNSNGNQGGIVGSPDNSNGNHYTISNCWVKGTTSIHGRGGAISGAGIGNYSSNNYYEWTVKRNGNDVPYNGTGWGIMSGPQDVSGKAQIEPVNSWAALKRAMSVGVTGSGVITLADNVTDPDKTSSSYLTVPEGKTVVLNLNGKTINRNLTTAIEKGYVIYNRGTLTINGSGTITGGKNTNAGGGIYDYGTLTINGGSITGNTALRGGGIFEYYHTTNTTINGVSITENSATEEGGGIYVMIPISYTITICGGSTISNNSAVNKGGGIYYVEGTLKIKGKVTISGNTKGEDPNNVELYSGKSITIDDNLDPETSIGVYVQDITSFPRYITSGLSGKGVYSYFTSDNATYAVRPYDDNNAEACLKRIISPTVSMSGWTYGSNPSNPSVPNKPTSVAVTYTYKAEGESEFSTDKPIVAGTHTVKATTAETSSYTAGEATNTYTVAKREVTLSWDNTSLTYNKETQKPTASVSNKVGDDICDVTVSGEQTNASDVAYTATASALTGTHSANYKLPTTLPTQTFTIGKKDVIVSGITASDKTYDGNTTATIVATNASFDGLLDGDALSVSTSGTFADANVGTGKTVTFGALTLGGTSVGNYQLAASGQQTTTTADITQKALTVTANNHGITYGDAPDNNGVNYSGFVEGEGTGNLSGTLDYDYSYAQYGNVGNYTITPSGLNSTNYAISYLPGTLTVNQKLITVSGITANNKVYDKSTTATLDYTSSVLSGKVGSDDLSVSATGTFADCNVDNGISVSISGLTLGGTKVGNYDLAASGHQTSTTANITPKEVGINWGVTLLTYTGNPQAPVATATGLVGDDVCNVNVTGQQTDVGVYTGDAAATASSLSNANYKLPTTGLTTPFEIADGMSISFADGQQWATWYSDHDYLVPPGTTAYVVSDVNESTGAVTADAVTYVPKNVGVLVYRTATVADNITSDVYTGDTDASITSCLRNGAPTPYKDYILYNNGFVLSSVSTIGIHNCYLPGSAAAGARALFITIGDETTSLSFETTDDADSDRWYDMQGRRIEKPLKKGLYIRNGKKVVVK